MNGSPALGCTLNCVTLEFAATGKLRVGIQPYRDSDQLRELRDRHRESHFFRREREGIACVSLDPKQEPLGEAEERKLGDCVSLVASLALDALMRYFHDHGRAVWKHKPLRIVSSRPDDLLLRRALPKGVTLPTWIEQRVSYVFDTRLVFPENAAPGIVLACDVKTSNFIDAPCTTLIDAGIPLEGLYVQVRATDGDPRLSPKPKLVGRVDQIVRDESGGITLRLGDHEEGFEQVDAAVAFLEPRHENLELCVRSLAKGDADAILNRLDYLATTVNGGPERLKRVQAMFDHLRSQSFELAPGVAFKIGPLLKRGPKGQWFPRTDVIQKPHLVFSPAPGRTDTWNERGLGKYGPYDQNVFTPKRPRIAVICDAEYQGAVEQFLRRFFDGMPDTVYGKGTSARKPYEHGFSRRYALDGVDRALFVTKGASAGQYKDACNEAIKYAADKGFNWNLAIVQIRDAFHLLNGNENPYLVTKAAFMKHHIPVQEVTIEKMGSAPSDLVFILNDISLACYAKLDGTPWLLSANAAIAHELVVGIGSHHMRHSRIGSHERVVGITTVFSGDGQYLLESRTSAVSFEKYPQAILTTLRAAIERVRRDQNWRDTDTVRLIFHGFKEFRDAEVDAVDALMAELSLPHAEHAFVHLIDDHPFLAFDEANPGAWAPGSQKKGIFAPQRGTSIKFNRDEILVNFTGARELKQAKDGMPTPILLRLHRKSSFKDMTYLARQAFAFSCHSWRGFSPAPLPITTLYSQQIAKMLKSLEQVSGWDPDVMLGRIGTTRWFL